MSARNETALVSVCFISALALAVSFALPISVHSTYLNAEGKPAGWLGQMLHDTDSDRVTTNEYVWEDIHGLTPVVFFLPALLIALRQWGPARLRPALTVVTPVLAAVLLIPLVAMVALADLSIFPGMGSERAYGGYVAIGALSCFSIATSALAMSGFSRSNRRRSAVSCG